MKGNKSNHPRKYLTTEDFYKWVSNDFMHLKTKVARQEGISWLLVGLLSVILAKLLGMF